MSNIRAEDLAVGDTCEWTDGRVVTLALVEGNRLVYRMPDGDLKIGNATIVARSIEVGFVIHTPAATPTPNPAALGDLYEACKAMDEWAASDYFPECKGESGRRCEVVFGLICAALAKAENNGGGK